jgi:hypothetical protein
MLVALELRVVKLLIVKYKHKTKGRVHFSWCNEAMFKDYQYCD